MKRVRLPTLPALSRRERLLAAGSLVVICAVLLDHFVLGPWWRHTQRIRQEIHNLERALVAHQALLSRKEQVMPRVRAYHDHLRTGGAGEVEMAALLREIETLGSESGVSIREVKPLPSERRGPYQEHSMELRCEGTLEQWIRFLYLLEASKSLFQVERATLELEEPEQEVLEGSLRLTSAGIHGPPAPEQSTTAEPFHVSMVQ